MAKDKDEAKEEFDVDILEETVYENDNNILDDDILEDDELFLLASSSGNPIEDDLESAKVESDEEFLEDNDELTDDEVDYSEDAFLGSNNEMALLKQAEGTVLWRVDGLYNSKGALYGKNHLRRNPPIFTVESSDGSTAEFVLTRDLSYSMRESFDRVYQAYYGVTKKKKRKSLDQEGISSSGSSFVDYAKDNPFKVGFVALSVVLVIIMLIIL